MLRKTHIRRPVAVALMAAGALLMYSAPASWEGALILALGVSIELAGIAIKRKK